MKRITTLLVLYLLLAWGFPTQAKANTTPMVFDRDLKPITLIVPQNEPTPSQETKPSPQPKAKNTKAVKKVSNGCSCVLWVKAQIGYTKSVGNARNWPVNSHQPSVGSVVVTYESRAGHVGLVTAVDSEYITISEANYKKCSITTGRKLLISSNVIKGYWVPPMNGY